MVTYVNEGFEYPDSDIDFKELLEVLKKNRINPIIEVPKHLRNQFDQKILEEATQVTEINERILTYYRSEKHFVDNCRKWADALRTYVPQVYPEIGDAILAPLAILYIIYKIKKYTQNNVRNTVNPEPSNEEFDEYERKLNAYTNHAYHLTNMALQTTCQVSIKFYLKELGKLLPVFVELANETFVKWAPIFTARRYAYKKEQSRQTSRDNYKRKRSLKEKKS